VALLGHRLFFAPPMARIVVGMSGGVDSSLSAALLSEQGHEVVGVTMQLWPCAEQDGGFTREDSCCSPTETIDARAVAQGTGIRHYVVDMVDGFRESVVDAFIASYQAGQTPNPCVRCNEKIKFGSLWDYAKRLGADQVATGHYAQITKVFDRHVLRTAVDKNKDQTYFLFSLTQEQLAAAHFPVGGMTKDDVRSASRTRKLVTADKHESQDICFIGNEGVSGFLRERIPESFIPGPIIHENGTKLGEHTGLAAYTVGQRKGLGVAWSEPLYVVKLDHDKNTVILGTQSSLLITEMDLTDCTWHLGELSEHGLSCFIRTRHRGKLVPAHIIPRPGVGPTGLPNATVRYQSPQMRTNVGQACVTYDEKEDLCLGGGWISATR
jgi:tRNA-uridine 2-sulfurtransferase